MNSLEGLYIRHAPPELAKLVTEVARATGVSPVPTALVDWRLTRQLNAAATSRVVPDTNEVEYGIILPPDAINAFGSVQALKAAIAHELGHIQQRHEDRMLAIMRKHEYQADEFAVSHGFDLTPVLERSPRFTQAEAKRETHPTPQQRIARIRRLAK